MAEHYGRIVNGEQGKIDSCRDPKEKLVAEQESALENAEDDEQISQTFWSI